jgi:uncharacterized protein YjbJ (UPF0337 family)
MTRRVGVRSTAAVDADRNRAGSRLKEPVAGKEPGIRSKGARMNEATKLKWEGRWDQLKGKVKEQWGDLTDDDLDVTEGNWDQMVGRIKERTGQRAEDIERDLDALY